MLWNKAGRGKHHDDFKKIQVDININIIVDDKPWTKEEMTLYTNGVLALAQAIVYQWIRDGKPDKDKKGVEPWIGILKQFGFSDRMRTTKH